MARRRRWKYFLCHFMFRAAWVSLVKGNILPCEVYRCSAQHIRSEYAATWQRLVALVQVDHPCQSSFLDKICAIQFLLRQIEANRNEGSTLRTRASELGRLLVLLDHLQCHILQPVANIPITVGLLDPGNVWTHFCWGLLYPGEK